ncbi:MAG: ABC transporter permease, partial [Deltaproteobacteria bacterium]|nr:ABC transporter permease [Deltaproteobacteria bacterium]
EPAARKLNTSTGGEVIGRVGRTFQGVREQATVRLRVVAVLPIGAFPRQAAFVRLPLLEATEDFRDGRSSAAFDWPGRPPPEGPREYPSFRLYARSIYDVPALRDLLADQGLEVYTKAEDIAVVKSLDRAFTLIFQLIAIVAVFGYFASMASSVLANVKRKSRHLGVTRLIGFSTSSMVCFPMIQAVATGLLGTGAAVGIYFITEAVINRLFAQYLGPGEYVCHLGAGHVLAALGLTLAISILASAFAAVQVARIEPSEVIRDV